MLTLVLLAGCAHRPPEAAAKRTMVLDPAGWPEAVRAPMLAAQVRGLTLARRDAYAWRASDRVAEAVGTPLLPALPEDLRGYVIDERGPERAFVHFVRETPGGLASAVRVLCDAAHPDCAVESASDIPWNADSELARRHRATLAAIADPRFVRKVQSYNPDVVPWSDDGDEGWAVYLVPGASDYAHVPLGGGYRAHVSPDGATVIAFDALSNGVLDVPVSELRGKDAAYTATVLTPLPDATYIMFSKIWDISMFVITRDAVWGMVRGDTLSWMPLDAK